MDQKQLSKLEEKYKSYEREALNISKVPNEKYLCIRLDAVGATRHYLKDKVLNKEFIDLMNTINEKLIRLLKSSLSKDCLSAVICTFCANDELSIVLNSQNNHRYINRVMKLCSLVSGALSAFASQTPIDEKRIIYFDARPIFLTQTEIPEYIYTRYYMFERYAHWKLLRLNNIENVFDDSIKKNLDNCKKLTSDFNYSKEAVTLIETNRILIPSLNSKEIKESTVKSFKDDLDYFMKKLSKTTTHE